MEAEESREEMDGRSSLAVRTARLAGGRGVVVCRQSKSGEDRWALCVELVLDIETGILVCYAEAQVNVVQHVAFQIVGKECFTDDDGVVFVCRILQPRDIPLALKLG